MNASETIRHVALLFRSGQRAQALAVQASEWDIEDGLLRLYRDGRVVWRGPRAQLKDVLGFADQLACADRCREHRESLAGAGAATIGLQESGTAPRLRGPVRRGRTAIPAEGIRFVMED